MISRRRRRAARSGTPSRVGFFGVLGSGNLGNDASLDVVVTHLRRHHPEVGLGFFAMGPEVLARRYDAPAVHLQWYEANAARFSSLPPLLLKATGRLIDPLRTLRWIRGYDVVVVPGAGVLETTTPMRPWAMPWSLLALGAAARLTGTTVALVAVGADVVGGRPTRWILGRSARLAHYRSYRDELSRATVGGLGVDVRDDAVFADLAFALEPAPVVRPVVTPVAASGAASGDHTIGVGVMNFRGQDADRGRGEELHEGYVDAVRRLVTILAEEGWCVRLLAGDGEDEAVQRRVLDALPDRLRARVRQEGAGTLQDLMRIMAGLDLVVATRFHNVQAALRSSVPTVSLSYARKQDVLMETMGLGGFCEPAASIDVDRVLERVHTLDADRAAVVARLRERNDAQAELVRRQLEAVSGLVQPGCSSRVSGDRANR